MNNDIEKENIENDFIIIEDDFEIEDDFSWEDFIKSEVNGRIADFFENDS